MTIVELIEKAKSTSIDDKKIEELNNRIVEFDKETNAQKSRFDMNFTYAI